MTRYRIFQSADDGLFYVKKQIFLFFWKKNSNKRFLSLADAETYVKMELGIKGWRSRPWFDEFVMEISFTS